MAPQIENSTFSNRGSFSRGFSLIELLIVVAVILIIAAIAIPNYIQTKIRANEASAAQNLRNISTAEILYASTYGIYYSVDLPTLSGNTAVPDQTHADLIDEVLASGTKSGYNFVYAPVAMDAQGHVVEFSVNANPLSPGTTGQRYFYTDQTCVIRSNINTVAGITDPVIQ
jgi:type IV pilus assembly protein PilA